MSKTGLHRLADSLRRLPTLRLHIRRGRLIVSRYIGGQPLVPFSYRAVAYDLGGLCAIGNGDTRQEAVAMTGCLR